MKTSLNFRLIFAFLAVLALGIVLGKTVFSGGESSEHKHNSTSDAQQTYTCSMHPNIRQEGPGSCPICGMDLIPVSSSNSNQDFVGFAKDQFVKTGIQGFIIQKDSKMAKNRVSGKIVVRDDASFTITSRFSGRVDELISLEAGKSIKKGQILGQIYAPEMIGAQSELLGLVQRLGEEHDLVKSTKNKLRLLGAPESFIGEVIRSGKTTNHIPLVADYSGTISKVNVTLGEYISPQKTLFSLSNVDALWAEVRVFPHQLKGISLGDSALIYPTIGETIPGVVDFVFPESERDNATKMRVRLADSDNRIRPGTIVEAEIRSMLSNVMEIPSSSILWMGSKSLVYKIVRKRDEISLRPQYITLGRKTDMGYLVESGISEGDELALNAAFKIDASAQLAGFESMMNPESGAFQGHKHDGENASNHAHEDIDFDDVSVKAAVGREFVGYLGKPIPKEISEHFAHINDMYLDIKRALVKSDNSKGTVAAQKLSKMIDQISTSEVSQEWKDFVSMFRTSTKRISDAKSIDDARTHFATLTSMMLVLMESADEGNSLFLQFCPMAFDDEGGYWISDYEEIENPYFGDAMLSCGEVVKR